MQGWWATYHAISAFANAGFSNVSDGEIIFIILFIQTIALGFSLLFLLIFVSGLLRINNHPFILFMLSFAILYDNLMSNLFCVRKQQFKENELRKSRRLYLCQLWQHRLPARPVCSNQAASKMFRQNPGFSFDAF